MPTIDAHRAYRSFTVEPGAFLDLRWVRLYRGKPIRIITRWVGAGFVLSCMLCRVCLCVCVHQTHQRQKHQNNTQLLLRDSGRGRLHPGGGHGRHNGLPLHGQPKVGTTGPVFMYMSVYVCVCWGVGVGEEECGC